MDRQGAAGFYIFVENYLGDRDATHALADQRLNSILRLIATTLIPSVLSSIPWWGWLDVLFTLSVLVGVCLEVEWIQKRLVPDKPIDLLPASLRRTKLKKRGEILLVVGLAGELACLPIGLWEASKVNERVEGLRKTNDELEIKIAAADPRTQRVKTVTAFAHFSISPPLPPGNGKPGRSLLTFSTRRFPGLPGVNALTLTAENCDHDYDGTFYIEFGWWHPSVGNVIGASPGETAEQLTNSLANCTLEINRLNPITVPLPTNLPSYELEGSVTLTVNSLVQQKFTLPKQKLNPYVFVPYGFVNP